MAKKAKKAKKAKQAKTSVPSRGRRVVVKLNTVRAELEKGISTLQAEVAEALQRSKTPRNKKTVAQAKRRITYLKRAVRSLSRECPDKVLNVDFTFE